MANLASAGSHAINGVAALHTELLKQTVLRDFHTIAPEKFFNVTNGVTPRRWLALSNPRLSALITGHIGDRWTADLENELARLEPLATDRGFQRDWQEVKAANKGALAALLEERTGIVVDPQSLFDVQVKRLHEYKRQHLNVLYLVTLYNRLTRDTGTSGAPRTVIFGGKAAPGYRMAKLIIRLITGVAEVVNGDPKVSSRLKVVFLPDFNVKTSHHVYPAADLSEQLSMAGKEASGTGNMKFAMNGALTIGTLDGANVEIRDAVGPEHFFLFGMTAPEVAARKAQGYRAARRLRGQRGAARDARSDRQRPVLQGRSGDVPAAPPLAPRTGRVHAAGRLPGLRRCAAARERRLGQPAGVDPHVDPQLRESGPVLVGPVDPGLLPGHLEHQSTGAGRSQW